MDVEPKYLGRLLADGWKVVGYSVHHEDGEPQERETRHEILVQKDSQLRTYNFFVQSGKLLDSSEVDFQTGVDD